VNESIRFGSIRGIEVGCNWSVLVIGALLAWGLADGYLPDAAPGYRTGEYWVTALVAVVLFFASLLAHEVGHSLVAQRRGVQVDSITLWLFGGVARLRGEARTPRAELAIATAGPGVSLAAAVGAGLAALALDALGASELVVDACAWLAFINAVLVVFNLVPAAPLDGGRILHSIVWGATHDRDRATRISTGSGRAFGYLLIGAGILMVAGGYLGGAWMALVGWFVVSAATAEATHALLEGALAGVRVRDAMTADPVVVNADDAVSAVLDDAFVRHHFSSFPVVDDAGAVVGLLTLRGVRRVPPEDRSVRRALDAAIPLERAAVVHPNDQLVDVLEHAAPDAEGDGRMLVFEGGRLVGIVSPTDVNRALQLATLRGERPRRD
jgi:Zn-dependent protease/CBS domain-containing protein